VSTAPFDIHPDRAATLYAIRDRHIGTAATTQRHRLLDALKTLGHVTTFEAMRYLDIFDPRPRKLELVRDGHTIITLRRTAETEAGIKHRIGVYVMARGAPGGVPDQPAANDPKKKKCPRCDTHTQGRQKSESRLCRSSRLHARCSGHDLPPPAVPMRRKSGLKIT